MGKIQDLQNNQKNLNLTYIKYSKQTKLQIKGFKDLLTLMGPTAHRYRLSQKQRNFQLAGRMTIAAIASALTISNGAIHIANHLANQNSIQTEASTQMNNSEKENIVDYAENKLLVTVFQNRLSLMKDAKIKYSHNDKLNSDTLAIYRDIEGANADSIIDFSYTRYNNPEDQNLNQDENLEINQFCNSMINMHHNEKPSKEELKSLNSMASKLKPLQYNLEGTKLVKNEEKSFNYDYER